jgi:hypothetical protein
MARSSFLSFGLTLLPVFAGAQTLYYPKNQVILGGSVVSSLAASATVPNVPAATFTGAAAYNPTTLVAPAAPSPAITTNFGLQLLSGGMTNMSRQIPSNYLGFSIEMSVFNQFRASQHLSLLSTRFTNPFFSREEQVYPHRCVRRFLPPSYLFHPRSSLINVPFLNLVANVVARSGSMQIRVGGNSQETAELVDSIPNGNGSIISKDLNNIFNHNTPPITYTRDLFYLMRNISALVNVDWHMGALPAQSGRHKR